MRKKLSFVIIISLFLCYLSSALFAEELKTTKIIVTSKNNYDIILNNAISINNIALKSKNDTSFVEFPVYVGNGRIYKQFSVLKREYEKYLASSIETKNEEKFEGDILFIVNKFSKTQKEGNIKAFASVIFEDVLEVECRVMHGKNGLWIAWPSNKKDGKWVNIFSFTDKDLKKRVEGDLIQKYNNENERK